MPKTLWRCWLHWNFPPVVFLRTILTRESLTLDFVSVLIFCRIYEWKRDLFVLVCIWKLSSCYLSYLSRSVTFLVVMIAYLQEATSGGRACLSFPLRMQSIVGREALAAETVHGYGGRLFAASQRVRKQRARLEVGLDYSPQCLPLVTLFQLGPTSQRLHGFPK